MLERVAHTIRRALNPMNARLLIALFQPLLALLLLAGEPAAVRGALDDAAFARSEDSLKIVGLVKSNAARESDESEMRGLPERSDGDGLDPVAVPADLPRLILDRARIIRVGCSAYPTAPPSHRPCAAPPTGPPFV